MSDLAQWIIVGVLVAAAVVFLVKRLKPSSKGCCCAGCPYAGTCSSARDGRTDCTPDERQRKAESRPKTPEN